MLAGVKPYGTDAIGSVRDKQKILSSHERIKRLRESIEYFRKQKRFSQTLIDEYVSQLKTLLKKNAN